LGGTAHRPFVFKTGESNAFLNHESFAVPGVLGSCFHRGFGADHRRTQDHDRRNGVRVNTFAVLLLAYPFYLAVNGRLIAYIQLATSATAASGATSAANTTPSSSLMQPAVESLLN
jgi:hypothetical protein